MRRRSVVLHHPEEADVLLGLVVRVGSIHPNGVDDAGLPYGTTTCFPLPTVEVIGNPNIP